MDKRKRRTIFFRSYDNAHAADGGREGLSLNRRRLERDNEDGVFERELRHRVISASIFMLGIPLILIVRNENMYKFCKKQLKCQ